MSPIVVTVKIRPRYAALAISTSARDAEIYDRVTGRREPKRPHRASYSLLDYVHTVDYLNDRVSAYPVPSALLTLRSEHNEDRRQANRRRSTRGKSRAARK